MTVTGDFTADEPLRVEMDIEKRASKPWLSRGCRQFAALTDGLQTEREVLEEFFRARFSLHQPEPQPRTLRKAGCKRAIRLCSGENQLTEYITKE